MDSLWKACFPVEPRARRFLNEFGAVDAVTAPDLMTEIDAAVLLVEHGLVPDTTDLAPISSGDQVIDRTN